MGYDGKFISCDKPVKPPPKEHKQLKRTAIKPKYKPTGELEVFREIWDERPHKSEVSGEPLFDIDHHQWINQFSHILPKGKYGRYRLLKRNIKLVTPKEHSDYGEAEYMVRNDERWAWVFELRDKLKQEYN